MKIYTYGVIDSNSIIAETIRGLEGACVYNIPYRDIGAVVSKQVYQIKEINRQDVLMHEEVVERLMEKSTILPVRFLTTFNQEEEVLVVLKEFYQDFKENLDRLRNKVEFGIRVIWPGETIRNRIIEAHKKTNADTVITGDTPAKSFIEAKFQDYKVDIEFQKEADKHISLIDNFFNRFISDKKLEKLRSNNLLLSASYLIEKERQYEFKEAFQRARRTPGNLKFLMTGPWPPYNFINLKRKPYCLKEFEGLDILEKEKSVQNLDVKETVSI